MNFLRRFWRWINRSIQRKLVIWTTIFWIISLSILSLTLIFTSQARMIQEANQRNTKLASVASRDISVQIGSIFSDVRFFATHLESISISPENQAEALLALRLVSPNRYRAAYYFNSQGNLLFHLTDDRDVLSSLSIFTILQRPDIELQDGVTEAYRQVKGELYISEVAFTGIDRSPIIYTGIPVGEGTSDYGVVILELDMQDIWQSIDLMTVGQSGITYMVTGDGTMIAHPDRAYIGRPMPVELTPLLSGREDYAEYVEPFRKQPVLSAYSPVGGQTGWGIVIQQDKSEAYAAVSGTVALSIGIWSFLAAIGAAGILIAVRKFARPIVNLTETAQYIARTGELTRTAMAQKPDEVGQLSQAFDGMIDKLESAEDEIDHAREELENRVTVRTAELTETNALLNKEILQRESVEQALRDNELKYRHLVQNATTIILELDTEGRVTFFNQFAEQFFGFKESEIIGSSVIGTIVQAQDSAGKDLEAMIFDIVKNPDNYRHNENENVKKNGEKVWVVWSNQPLYDEDGRLRKILCVGMDMTEQKKNEEMADRQAREQAAVTERTRLARDLHDAVSQTLFSASLIAEVLPRIWERNPEEGRRRLEEIRQLTKGALAEMRTLLFELRPAALTDAELSDLLRQLAESVTGRARVPVTTQFEGHCPLPPDTKIALYRIAQEALNNIAKHSGADQAQVTLNSQSGRVAMYIKDNGRGFEMSNVKGNSLGLGIMQERARAIGASLTIRSEGGRGTEITVIWGNLSKEDLS